MEDTAGVAGPTNSDLLRTDLLTKEGTLYYLQAAGLLVFLDLVSDFIWFVLIRINVIHKYYEVFL